MNEVAQSQGEAPVSIDLSQDDHQQPGSAEPNAPTAKKLKLKYSEQTSSGSSAVGRPSGSLWSFFTKVQ